MWSYLLAATLAIATPIADRDAELMASMIALDDAERFDEAAEAAAKLIAFRRGELGQNHPDVADALLLKGDLHEVQADHAGSEVAYRAALDIRKNAFGSGDWRVAECGCQIGRALRSQGRYDESDAAYSRATRILRAQSADGPEDDMAMARCLNGLGMLNRERGLHDAASDAYEESLSIHEGLGSTLTVEFATTTANLAGLQKARGHYAQARDLYLHALAIYAENEGVEIDQATILNNLGSLTYIEADYTTSQKYFEDALAIQRRILGERHPSVATGLGNLAVSLQVQGRYDEARALLEQSLRIRVEAYGEDHVLVTNALHNLGNVLKELGHYAKARPLLERSLAIRRSILAPEHPLIASAVNDLGGLLKVQGDMHGARAMFEESLALRIAVLGDDHPDVASSLHNLGTVLGDMGLTDQAEEVYRRSIAIRRAALGDRHPRVGLTLSNIAGMLHDGGDFDTAEKLYLESLELLVDALGPNHHLVAVATANLGVHYLHRGQPARGEPYMEAGQRMTAERLGAGHPTTADMTSNLATIKSELGKVEEAFELRVQAVAAFEDHLDLLDSLSEREAMNWLRASRKQLDGWISASASKSELDAQAWIHTLRFKGAISSRHRAARAPTDRQSKAAVDDLAAVRRDLARLAFAAYEPEDAEERRAALAALSAKKEALERRLLQNAAFRDAQAVEDATPRALCDVLPRHTTLIDLLRYGGRDTGHYLAFVMRQGDCRIRRIEIGEAAPIDASITAWRTVLQDGDAMDSRLDRRGAELSALLWAPLDQAVGDAKRIIIVPDGPLSSVPFGALPVDDGYLIEAHTLTYLDRSNDLLRPETDEGKGALVVGGIDYDTAAIDRESATATAPCVEMGFAPLPGASQEAARVAGRWSRMRPGEPLVTLGGAAASEAAVAGAIRGKAVVHLATHGFFATGRCKSALERGDGGFNPMLLSGLVFAGANHPADPLSYADGILTAEEVASIDLRGTGLVVLSACETGLGEVKSGEGVIGLRRAFATSGVESLVMSLWSIPDDATADLMDDLYRHYLRRRTTASDSLRSAQLAMIQRNRKEFGSARPHQWAAFVAAGR